MTGLMPLGWARRGGAPPSGVEARREGNIVALYAPGTCNRLALQVACHGALDPFLPTPLASDDTGAWDEERLTLFLEHVEGAGQLTLALAPVQPRPAAPTGRARLRAGARRLRAREAARDALACIARELPAHAACPRSGRRGDVIDLLYPRRDLAGLGRALAAAAQSAGLPPGQVLATGLWPVFAAERLLTQPQIRVPGDGA